MENKYQIFVIKEGVEDMKPKMVVLDVVKVYDFMTKKGMTRKWTIVNKKDTIFKYIFWERLDSLPIPECCFHFIWC